MTDYRFDVIPKVIELLPEYSYRPSIRGMFYRLVSEKVISNTFEEYKGLVRALSTARKKRPGQSGYIDPMAFADDTRFIENIDDTFSSYESVIDSKIHFLKNAARLYLEGGYLPKWYRQPNYVEVMIEKDALRGAFKSVLPLDFVRIVPNKGWSSIPYRTNNIARLVNRKHGFVNGDYGNDISKNVYVLYFGDYDPSGIAMSQKSKDHMVSDW